MREKVILLSLVFFALTNMCFADVAAQLLQAETYRGNGSYLEAEDIYKTIVNESPRTGDALQAQKELIILYNSIKMDTFAKAELDKLTADFATYSEPNDVAQALFDIARQYEWSAKYKEANIVFQQIIDEQPQSWYVNRTDLAVPRTHIMSLLASGRYDEAQTAINKLMANSNFAKHPDFPETIFGIGKRYEWSHKYEEALIYYLKLVQQYPKSPSASKVPLNARKAAISHLIESKNDAQTETEINRLMTDFTGQPALAGALYGIAEKYEWSFQFEKAQNFYQQVLQQSPDSSQVNNARLGIAKTDILLLINSGQDDAALTAINKLIVDFKGHLGLATGVSWIAEQYQIKASEIEKESSVDSKQVRDCLSKAIVIWEKVINEHQDPVVVPQSCCYAGDCYRKLGDYVKSAECYQKVVEDYPGNTMAWHALFMVGRNYEDIGKSGLIPRTEADTKTKAAYQQLVETYPGCKAAKAAQSWLDRNNSK